MITGPSGSGCHSVVLVAGRACRRLTIFASRRRRRCRCVIESPADIPAVLRTWIVVSPCARGDREAGIREPEQVEAARRERRPGRDLDRREDRLLRLRAASASSWRCRRRARRRYTAR